jgi:uncharacterized RDD family membrane protein YckC
MSHEISKYPSIRKRYFSSLIDFSICLLAALSVISLVGFESMPAWGFYLIAAVVSLYEPLLISRSQTVGQWIAGIRVRDYEERGRLLSFPRACARSFVKGMLGIISFFSISFSNERRTIHDHCCGSIVLRKD